MILQWIEFWVKNLVGVEYFQWMEFWVKSLKKSGLELNILNGIKFLKKDLEAVHRIYICIWMFS